MGDNYYTSGELTHGGYPISEVWTWDSDTHKKLGAVLYGLLQADQKTRWHAYAEYYNLRNRFVLDDFEFGINRLDEYRERIGHVPMREMINRVSLEMVKREKPNIPDEKPVMPELSEIKIAVRVAKIDIKAPVPTVECEQMSLF